MATKTKSVATIASRVKDMSPELDDVRSVTLENRETPTPYDLRLIAGMASHQLPVEEICSILGVPKSRFEKNLEMQAAYQQGINQGKATLRRMMFVSAKTNPVMQIWLSKQHLGMADKVETQQGDSQIDAYKGFLDKLSVIVNVHTEGRTTPKVVGAGKGDSEVLLETVGEGRSTPTESGVVVTSGENSQVDRGVEEKAPERNIHGLLEDLVIPGGTGKRENQSRSRVGSHTD
jgi:hypothetical protein